MIFELALIAATLLCTLVTGLVLAFAVVVMPGIASLAPPSSCARSSGSIA